MSALPTAGVCRWCGDACALDEWECVECGGWSEHPRRDHRDVCVDCLEVTANGVTGDFVESLDETRERAAGVWPRPIEYAAPVGDFDEFSKAPCECCGSRLFGSRHGVFVVWAEGGAS